VAGDPGDVVDVPILIDDPSGLQAFAFDLLFDRDVASYEYTTPSILTRGWPALDGSENAQGAVTIGGFATEPISSSSPDTLCYVTLTVLITGHLSLAVTDFQDDLAGTPDCIDSLTAIDASSWGRMKAFYGGE
jgi:hypothetical protein